GDFVLETDASDTGLGACLRQNGRPVAYLSRTLIGAEKNYGITDREVLASLWTMEKLQYHLVGKKFKLVTDHKAIEFIKTKVEFGSARIQRWFKRFEKFNFDVEYRKGVEMITSDALSKSQDNKILSVIYNLNSEDELQNKVIIHHIKLNHRKKIQADMGKIGIKYPRIK
ncbi:Retrovirus-related Pol polyprotein from transposon, partial [Nosema granulosis]